MRKTEKQMPRSGHVPARSPWSVEPVGQFVNNCSNPAAAGHPACIPSVQHEGAATVLTPQSSYVPAPATLTDRTASSSQRGARRSKF